MNRDGLRAVLSVVMLILALAALRRMFLEWTAALPQSAPANGRALVQPKLLGQQGNGIFHDDCCEVIMESCRPGVPVPRPEAGPLVTFRTRREALEAGYKPCPKCLP